MIALPLDTITDPAAALASFFEQAALAVEAADPVTALRFALLANELRPGAVR